MKKVYHLTYWLFAALLISSCSLDDVDIGQKDSFVKFFDIGEGYAMEETSDGGFILIGTFEDISTTEAQICDSLAKPTARALFPDNAQPARTGCLRPGQPSPDSTSHSAEVRPASPDRPDRPRPARIRSLRTESR